MQCQNCQLENPETARYCAACRQPLAGAPADRPDYTDGIWLLPPVPAIDDHASAALAAGSGLQAMAEPEPEAAAPKAADNWLPRLVFFAAVFIVGVGLGIGGSDWFKQSGRLPPAALHDEDAERGYPAFAGGITQRAAPGAGRIALDDAGPDGTLAAPPAATPAPVPAAAEPPAADTSPPAPARAARHASKRRHAAVADAGRSTPAAIPPAPPSVAAPEPQAAEAPAADAASAAIPATPPVAAAKAEPPAAARAAKPASKHRHRARDRKTGSGHSSRTAPARQPPPASAPQRALVRKRTAPDQEKPAATAWQTAEMKPVSKRSQLHQCENYDSWLEREKCKWRICNNQWGQHGCPAYPSPRSQQ